MADLIGEIDQNLFGGLNTFTSTANNNDLSDAESSVGSTADLSGDYEALMKAWKNEVASPTLLPMDEDVITTIILLLKNQETLVTQLSSSVTSPTTALQLNLYRIELDRTKYVLADYLRTRIRKIERNVLWYLRSYSDGFQYKLNPNHDIHDSESPKEIKTMYMSSKELKFAKGFKKIYEKHMFETVLKHLPETVLDSQPQLNLNLQSLEDTQMSNMIDSPKFDAYVLGRFLVDGQGDGWDDYKKGNMVLGVWDELREKVEGGQVELCP